MVYYERLECFKHAPSASLFSSTPGLQSAVLIMMAEDYGDWQLNFEW